VVSVEVLSPAKINLMLRVLNKREDGYHDLQTCFQLIDWGDYIRFTQKKANGNNHIEIEGFDDLATEDNLIYKAANSLKSHATKHSDWCIQVNKLIPQGAGLGGGSSNAALTLKFLNQHWHCGLNEMQLISMGRDLGADVPVFLAGKSSVAGGIGDELKPMVFDTPAILLMLPEVRINTAALFSHPKLKRNQAPLNQANLLNPAFWVNDFFPVVLHVYPEIKEIYDTLKSTIDVRLSGTGAALFAVFNTEEKALEAEKLASKYVSSRVVKPQIRLRF